MASSILDQNAIVISLTAEDHNHLEALINAADVALPNDTDSDNSRAVLRSVQEFLARLWVQHQSVDLDASPRDAPLLESAVPSGEPLRQEIARSALHEAQELALALRRIVNVEVTTDGGVAVVARGMLTRISDLTDIVHAVCFVDDEERPSTSNLAAKLGDCAEV